MKLRSHKIVYFLGIICLVCAMHARADVVTFEKLHTLTQGSDGIVQPTHGIVSADGNYLYAVDPLVNTLTGFKRNTSDNTFATTINNIYMQGVNGVDGMQAASKIALSPPAVDNNGYLYVIGRPSLFPDTSAVPDTLAVYQRDAATGSLAFVDIFRDDPATAQMKRPGDLVVSPDGQQVYVTGEIDNTIAVFHFDSGVNKLSLVQVLDSATIADLQTPGALAISDDGLNVYVAANGKNAILEFSRNVTTGALTYLGAINNGDISLSGLTIDHLMAPLSLTLNHDGTNLYAGSFSSSAIVAFTRNSGDGSLNYISSYFDDGTLANPYVGLTDVIDLHVTADDGMIVALGKDSITALNRDKTTGQIISLSGIVSDNPAGDFAINNATTLAMAPDSGELYTISGNQGIGIYSMKGCTTLNPMVSVSAVSNVDEGAALPVTLDGSGSKAYCGYINSYLWEQVGNGPQVTVQNASSVSAGFIAPASINGDEILTFRLTVTDSNGLASSSDVTVKIVDTTIDAAPTAVDDMCIVQPGSETIIPVLNNDIDDHGSANLTVVPQPLSSNLQGTVTYTDQAISYKAPDLPTGAGASDSLTDEFNYSVSDNVNPSSLSATVKVLVTKMAVLSNDTVFAQSGVENKLYVLANDIAANPVLILDSVVSDQGGSISVNDDGSISYIPPASMVNGQDSFRYNVTSQAIQAFAQTNSLSLTQNADPCLQTIQTATVTINVQQDSVVNNKPGEGGSVSGGSDNSSSGGGSFSPISIIVLFIVVVVVIQKRRKIENR